MKPVIVEVPGVVGDGVMRERRALYARRACRQLIHLGFAPFCGELLFSQTGILLEFERHHSVAASRAIADALNVTHYVFGDLGVSEDMHKSTLDAARAGREIKLVGVKGWENAGF